MINNITNSINLLEPFLPNIQNDKDIKSSVDIQSLPKTNSDFNLFMLSQIDNYIYQENSLYDKFNLAFRVYEYLSEIRKNLTTLQEKLEKTDYDDFTNLEKLDLKANSLINNALNFVKNRDNQGLLPETVLNSYMQGLNSFKNLNMYDENYLIKLKDILIKLNEEEKSFSSLSDKYLQTVNMISNTLETNLESSYIFNKNDLKNDIINNSDTIFAISSKLSSENVAYLLEKKF